MGQENNSLKLIIGLFIKNLNIFAPMQWLNCSTLKHDLYRKWEKTLSWEHVVHTGLKKGNNCKNNSYPQFVGRNKAQIHKWKGLFKES